MKQKEYSAPVAEAIEFKLQSVICESVPIGGGEGSTETPEEP